MTGRSPSSGLSVTRDLRRSEYEALVLQPAACAGSLRPRRDCWFGTIRHFVMAVTSEEAMSAPSCPHQKRRGLPAQSRGDGHDRTRGIRSRRCHDQGCGLRSYRCRSRMDRFVRGDVRLESASFCCFRIRNPRLRSSAGCLASNRADASARTTVASRTCRGRGASVGGSGGPEPPIPDSATAPELGFTIDARRRADTAEKSRPANGTPAGDLAFRGRGLAPFPPHCLARTRKSVPRPKCGGRDVHCGGRDIEV
jgi:hypothetical protein